jgi:hypothetical protein
MVAQLLLRLLVLARAATGTTWYVGCGPSDADSNAGTVPTAGWRTLARVNAARLVGGDSVLFQRGCAWRGGYINGQGGLPGRPVTYGAFGSADLPKPQLLGSVSPQPTDWSPVGGAAGGWLVNVSALWHRAAGNFTTAPGITDVGNIVIGQNGSNSAAPEPLRAAVKKWSAFELSAQDQFYFNFSTGGPAASADALLYYHSPAGNPSTLHSTIELAIMTTEHAVIKNSNISHVIYEDLEIKFSGADGMYGVAVRDFVVRRCDLSWIGGGCLEAGPRWHDPLECTRFGNGIEFPDFGQDFEHLTEDVAIYDNRLSQVYDAALSPQGDGSYIQRNISLHHNLITTSEYCLEIWSQGYANEVRVRRTPLCFKFQLQNDDLPRQAQDKNARETQKTKRRIFTQSTMEDVRFLNNVCVNSGGGWSHAVRPDPSGRHICSFSNSGNVSRVQIRNNLFFQAVPYQAGHWQGDPWGHTHCSKGSCGWEGDLAVDHNLW